jgi:GrpB-like predicted nucleotidyltransferase (UPF0157 family)
MITDAIKIRRTSSVHWEDAAEQAAAAPVQREEVQRGAQRGAWGERQKGMPKVKEATASKDEGEEEEEEEEITIQPYAPEWADWFKEEKARLNEALQGSAKGVEHIGSTAVPGLDSKPIIDCIVGLFNNHITLDAHLIECTAKLERAGYKWDESTVKYLGVDRRCLRRNNRHGNNIVNVHIVQYLGDDWLRHLAFRDYLVSHPAVVEEYAQNKWRWREQSKTTAQYSQYKNSYVPEVEKKALLWRVNQAVESKALVGAHVQRKNSRKNVLGRNSISLRATSLDAGKAESANSGAGSSAGSDAVVAGAGGAAGDTEHHTEEQTNLEQTNPPPSPSQMLSPATPRALRVTKRRVSRVDGGGAVLQLGVTEHRTKDLQTREFSQTFKSFKQKRESRQY